MGADPLALRARGQSAILTSFMQYLVDQRFLDSVLPIDDFFTPIVPGASREGEGSTVVDFDEARTASRARKGRLGVRRKRHGSQIYRRRMRIFIMSRCGIRKAGPHPGRARGAPLQAKIRDPLCSSRQTHWCATRRRHCVHWMKSWHRHSGCRWD